jgi:AGZA family xanthine/uracil permease-like MFS transporter
MVWATALAYVLDRRFLHAAGWLLAGAVLASFGVIHAYDLSSAGIVNKLGIFVAPEFAISYAAAALFLAGCHFIIGVSRRRSRNPSDSRQKSPGQ